MSRAGDRQLRILAKVDALACPPLWRVTGTGRSGGECVYHIRATTHAEAVAKAQGYRCRVRNCVLLTVPTEERAP